jgi:hypothetical protein
LTYGSAGADGFGVLGSGVLLLDVMSDEVTDCCSFKLGDGIDWLDEENEHVILAVKQLTHTGRLSSH